MKGLAAAFLLIFAGHNAVIAQMAYPVKEGLLDLRRWNADQHPVVALNGEWEFYWNRLILSQKMDSLAGPVLAQLSIPWNEQLIGGERLPKDGCASYRLRILVDDVDSLAFAVPAVFNSYAFWVDDRLVCTSGKVGATVATTIPQWRPQTVIASVQGDTVSVVFQIANFQHTRGGCAEIMRAGTPEHLTRLDARYRMTGMGLIILFAVAALAVFIIFFIVRAKASLYLGLLALGFAFRFLFSDLYFYHDLGIRLDWVWAARVEYMTIPMVVLFGSLFIATIYPQEFNRRMMNFFVVINALLIAATLLVDSSVFSQLLVIIQVVGLTMLLYSVFAILKALIYQRKGAWVTVLGTGVFVLVGFYNIYAFITLSDLNRTVIHSGYALALVLNVVSLLYRTPLRLSHEERDTLRFSDFYSDREKLNI